MSIKKNKITKGVYKQLPRDKKLKLNGNFYSFIKLRRFHFFSIKYKQLLHKYIGDIKNNLARSKHRIFFKKKNRLRLNNYLCYIELRLASILYHSFLISKIKLLKQYVNYKYLTINKKEIKSYNFKVHPQDILGINMKKANQNLLVNKSLKKSISYKFTLLKEFSLIKIKTKRTFYINPLFIKNIKIKDYNKNKKMNYYNIFTLMCKLYKN